MSKKQIALPVASAGVSHLIETTHDHPSGMATASRSATDMDALFHPARAFDHPDEVVENPDLTLNEKRAILASWASDACAVDAAPALRRPPGSKRAVKVDEIFEALRTLDKLAGERGASWTTRQVRRASIEAFRASRGSREGRSLH
jgi:hypothetical protein